MICPLCEKGILRTEQVKYSVYGIELGTFPSNVCSVCHEKWFDEATSKKIELLEKKKGLFGLSKKSKIAYSGNSLVLRLPEALVKYMDIHKEDEVLIHPEGKDKILIEFV